MVSAVIYRAIFPWAITHDTTWFSLGARLHIFMFRSEYISSILMAMSSFSIQFPCTKSYAANHYASFVTQLSLKRPHYRRKLEGRTRLSIRSPRDTGSRIKIGGPGQDSPASPLFSFVVYSQTWVKAATTKPSKIMGGVRSDFAYYGQVMIT